jgi:hypothetical protein
MTRLNERMWFNSKGDGINFCPIELRRVVDEAYLRRSHAVERNHIKKISLCTAFV